MNMFLLAIFLCGIALVGVMVIFAMVWHSNVHIYRGILLAAFIGFAVGLWWGIGAIAGNPAPIGWKTFQECKVLIRYFYRTPDSLYFLVGEGESQYLQMALDEDMLRELLKAQAEAQDKGTRLYMNLCDAQSQEKNGGQGQGNKEEQKGKKKGISSADISDPGIFYPEPPKPQPDKVVPPMPRIFGPQ